jgi:phenylacetate-CoA ligase
MTYDGDIHPASACDYVPVARLRDIQLRRLRAMVRLAYNNVALFRQRMDERDLTPDSVRDLTDLAKLPFTTKSDLRDTYPAGMFARPRKDIVRLHASSGTTGKPIVVAYTRRDVQVWASVMVRAFAAYGLNENDIIQNAYGYGLFTGGLGAHYGAEALGATVIPASGGNTERQLMMLQDFGVTAICCTPSYFLHMIERAGELGVDLKKLPLRAGVFGAEPWTDSMRRYIEAHASIRAYDIYGLTEIVGPGVACECREQSGLHIFEDHFFPEVIDPETGAPLPDGCEGELVLTTLSKQAMPMIRYRTRDITTLMTEPCPCGRTLRRMRRMGHRSDDMFIIRGVNVFPSQIESALLAVEGTLPHYEIELTREHGLDNMEVRVEVMANTARRMDLQKRLCEAIERVINIRVVVNPVPQHSIPRSEGKAKRVVDKRPLKGDTKRNKILQVSVEVEDKPGQLRAPSKALSEAGVNLGALTVAKDGKGKGTLRLLMKNPLRARAVLEKAGYTVDMDEVVAVEVPNKPGGLVQLLDVIEQHNINVEYMYAFAFRGEKGNAVMVFRFENPDGATEKLQSAGINMFASVEMFG